MIKVTKIDRATGRSKGDMWMTQYQFDNRALHKSVAVLPIIDHRIRCDSAFERQSAAQVVPDLSDMSIPVPADAVVTIEYTNTPLDLITPKQSYMEKIKNKRDYVRDAGIEHTIDDVVYIVATDPSTRSDIVGSVVGLDERGDTDAMQIWRMRDNTVVSITMANFKVMALAVHDHVNACYTRQDVLETIVDGAANADALRALDDTVDENGDIVPGVLNSGWPTHYVPPELE